MNALPRPRLLARNVYTLAERHKHPTRGGQNLTDRYKRLEKMLRGKESLQRQMADNPKGSTQAAAQTQASTGAKMTGDGTFRGFKIPVKPTEPQSDDCCMSGCAICVYDLYEESLEAYRESIGSLQTSLDKLGVPRHEWPKAIQPSSNGAQRPPSAASVSLSAFEAMELALKAKREKEAG